MRAARSGIFARWQPPKYKKSNSFLFHSHLYEQPKCSWKKTIKNKQDDKNTTPKRDLITIADLARCATIRLECIEFIYCTCVNGDRQSEQQSWRKTGEEKNIYFSYALETEYAISDNRHCCGERSGSYRGALSANQQTKIQTI